MLYSTITPEQKRVQLRDLLGSGDVKIEREAK